MKHLKEYKLWEQSRELTTEQEGFLNLSSGTIKAALLSTNTTADTDNSSKAYVGDIGTLD